MKTAVQQLIEWTHLLENSIGSITYTDADFRLLKQLREKFELFLPIEKQQIIDAYKDGFEENVRPRHEDAEEYFNEKFKP